MIKKYWGFLIVLFIVGLLYFYTPNQEKSKIQTVFPSDPDIFFCIPDCDVLKNNLGNWFSQQYLGRTFFKTESVFLKILSQAKNLWFGVYHQSKEGMNSSHFLIASHLQLSWWKWFLITRKMKIKHIKIPSNQSHRGRKCFVISKQLTGLENECYALFLNGVFLFSSDIDLLKKSILCYEKKDYLYKHSQSLLKILPDKFVFLSYFHMERIASLEKFLNGGFFFENMGDSLVSIVIEDKLCHNISISCETERLPSFFDLYYDHKLSLLSDVENDIFSSFVPQDTQFYYFQRFNHNAIALNCSDFFKNYQSIDSDQKRLFTSYFLKCLFSWMGDRFSSWYSIDNHWGFILGIKNKAKFWMFFDGWMKQYFAQSWKESVYRGTLIVSIDIMNGKKLFFMPYGETCFIGSSMEQLKTNLQLLHLEAPSLRSRPFFKKKFHNNLEWTHLFCEKQLASNKIKNWIMLALLFAKNNKDFKKYQYYSEVCSFVDTFIDHYIKKWETIPKIVMSAEKNFQKDHLINILKINFC